MPPALPPQPRRTVQLGWLAPILGGLAGSLAFDPFRMGFLIPLFPLGIFIGMRTAPSPRSALLRCLAGAFTYYMIAISWLLTLGRFYPIVMAGIVIAALYLAFFPALSAYALRRWFSRLPVFAHFAAFAALWVIAEWLRTLGQLAVPMVQIGHAWAPWPRLVQLAEFLGEAGLNAQVLIWSGGLLAAIQLAAALRGKKLAPDSVSPHAGDRLRSGSGNPLRPAVLTAALLGAGVVLMIFSFHRYSVWTERLDAAGDSKKLDVVLVQPNITQEEKIESVTEENDAVRDALLEKHTAVLEQLVAAEVTPGVDLVIFPESAYTDILFSIYQSNRDRVQRMMRPSGADLLAGASRVGLNPEMTRIERVWNSVWFIPGDGSAWESYDKIRLVPFGENLSVFRYIPFIGTIVAVGEFERGTSMTVFHTHGVPFSSLICFESYFGAQTRLAVRKGAEFITVVTNDGWYGHSAGPYQHHAQSILRAIETRRPILRCAYTGISSILDPAGRRLAGLGLEKRGVVHGEITPQSGITFFVRWGNFWMMSLGLIVLGALGYIARMKSADTQPDA